MKAIKVDGQDVEAVYKATRQALEYARSAKAPSICHLDTLRFAGHYIGDPQVYRPKDEAKKLRETRDPITLLRTKLSMPDGVRGDGRRGDGDRRGVGGVREERHRPAPEDAMKNVYA
jgi:Pyruvate/2-oxoglutarate dehydrogenase complex, dehydrogenase (E1) component, eukaryotic type, alpha subunit